MADGIVASDLKYNQGFNKHLLNLLKFNFLQRKKNISAWNLVTLNNETFPPPFRNGSIIKLIEELLKIIDYLSIIIEEDWLAILIEELINQT